MIIYRYAFFSSLRQGFTIFGWPGTCRVDQPALEFTEIYPLSPDCWN